MSDTPDSDNDVTNGGQPRRRRTGALVLGGTGLTTLAVLGVLATTGVIGGDDEPADVSTAHQGMVTGTVWVANEAGNSLTAINAATNEVVTTVTGIEGPHNVQVSPDGMSLWTVSGHDSYAAMLDSETLDLHGIVPTGSAPTHVVVSPDGATTYASNGSDGTVSVIETATMKPLGTIEVGQGPHGLRPSPDGRWVYVANMADGTLSAIDTLTNKVIADIEVGEAPAQVAFSPDGEFVYASLNGEDAVAKVDVASRTLVGKVAVGDGPIQTYVSGDNRYLLVANQGTEDEPGTTVSVIDTRTFEVSATVETGEGAHGIVVDPMSRHAYVTNIYGDDVAVLDLVELEIVARVPVGDSPNGVSFTPVTLDQQPDVALQLPGTVGESDPSMEEDMEGMEMD